MSTDATQGLMYKGWYEQNWYPVVESQFSKKGNIWEAKHDARIWKIAGDSLRAYKECRARGKRFEAFYWCHERTNGHWVREQTKNAMSPVVESNFSKRTRCNIREETLVPSVKTTRHYLSQEAAMHGANNLQLSYIEWSKLFENRTIKEATLKTRTTAPTTYDWTQEKLDATLRKYCADPDREEREDGHLTQSLSKKRMRDSRETTCAITWKQKHQRGHRQDKTRLNPHHMTKHEKTSMSSWRNDDPMHVQAKRHLTQSPSKSKIEQTNACGWTNSKRQQSRREQRYSIWRDVRKHRSHLEDIMLQYRSEQHDAAKPKTMWKKDAR